MDRRQMVVQRARQCFADRLDDVLHMIRQDRQEMRGWQEPAHVRAVVRRTIQEGAQADANAAAVTVTEVEFGRGAGEPDRGQERATTGLLLETGAYALEKVGRTAAA